MAEIILTATPALAGTDNCVGDGHIRSREDLAIISVAVPLGGQDAVAAALKRACGLSFPEPTLSVEAKGMRAIRSAPDQLMLILPHRAPDANARVRAELEGAAYTTDQTDVWAVLELDGPAALPALERLCPLDLSAPAFPEGAFARTVMEHMGAMILRLAAERFLLLCASSSAASFLHAVETSYHHVRD